MSAFLHDFFHEPVDLSSLAAFRIAIGALIAVSAFSYWRTARMILDPDGVLPYEVWKNGSDRRYFSLLRPLGGSRFVVRSVLAAYALAGVSLSLGFLTTWAAGAAFVLTVSLHHRNRYVLHSGDALLRMLTFLLIFADSGRV